MVEHTKEMFKENIKEQKRDKMEYKINQSKGENWEINLSDCVEGISKIKSDSVHFSIYSPPFASLYTYSP